MKTLHDISQDGDTPKKRIGRPPNSGVPCPGCGEKGHTVESCPSGEDPKVCYTCGIDKPRDNFYIVCSPEGERRVEGECKACKVLRSSKKYITPEGRAATIISSAKHSSEVFLTAKDILDMLEEQDWKCYYTGFPLTSDKGFYGFSLDRKDNSDRRYTKENVVICCWGINQMKRDIEFNEFISLCSDIANNHS